MLELLACGDGGDVAIADVAMMDGAIFEAIELKQFGLIVRVRVVRQQCALADDFGSHACSREASSRAANDVPLGCPLLLPVGFANCAHEGTVGSEGSTDHAFCHYTDDVTTLKAPLVARGANPRMLDSEMQTPITRYGAHHAFCHCTDDATTLRCKHQAHGILIVFVFGGDSALDDGD